MIRSTGTSEKFNERLSNFKPGKLMGLLNRFFNNSKSRNTEYQFKITMTESFVQVEHPAGKTEMIFMDFSTPNWSLNRKFDPSDQI